MKWDPTLPSMSLEKSLAKIDTELNAKKAALAPNKANAAG